MALPTARELELETLVRQRDSQVAELSDEVAHLRRYLAKQPTPSTSESTTVPPPFLSLLLPHIQAAQSQAQLGGASSRSSSAVASLTQRVHLLQDENDELYGLLRTSETGRLKEEVRALNRVVARLEKALSESHKALHSLSDELSKAHEATLTVARHPNHQQPGDTNSRKHSRSPSVSRPSHNGALAPGDKPLPTAPRAHKKAKLADGRAASPASSLVNARVPTGPSAVRAASPHPSPRNHEQSSATVSAGTKRRARSPPPHQDGPRRKLDRDREAADSKRRGVNSGPPGPQRERGDRGRERERVRDRGRDKARDRPGGQGGRDREKDAVRDGPRNREREKDRDRGREAKPPPRRPSPLRGHGSNGNASASGGASSRGGQDLGNNESSATDRTLAERMGLL